MTPEDEKRVQAGRENRERVDLYLENQRRQRAGQLITRVGEAAAFNPDTVGAAYEKAAELGVSPYALANDPEFLKSYQSQRNSLAALARSPSLMSFIDMDAVHAPLIHDELETLAAYNDSLKVNLADPAGSALGRAGERGLLNIRASNPLARQEQAATAMADATKTDAQLVEEAFLKATGRSQLPEGLDLSTDQAAEQAIHDLGLSPERFRLILEDKRLGARRAQLYPEHVTEQGIAAAIELQRMRERMDQLPLSPAASAMLEEYTAAPNLAEAGMVILRNPAGSLAFMAETLAESAPVIAASIIAAAATKSPAVGSAMLAGGGAVQESSATAIEFLRENGIEAKTPEDALAVLGNAEILQKAAEAGQARGTIIAMFELLGQAAAARLVFKSAAATAAAQVTVQGATGFTGEVAAQIAAGQEIDLKDALLEGLAEAIGGPLEYSVARRRVNEELQREAQAANQQATTITGINELVAKTKLRERSPKAFSRFLSQGGFDQRAIYIDGAELQAYAETRPEQLPLLGLSEAQLQAAVDRGGSVAVPLDVYMQNIPGRVTELEKLFVDHGRLQADAKSKAQGEAYKADEAQERRRELAEAQQNEMARETLRQQVESRVAAQIRRAGGSAAYAREQATLQGAFFETLARRFGNEQVASRFGLEVRGPASPRVDPEADERVFQQEMQAEEDAFQTDVPATDEPPQLSPEFREQLQAGQLPRGIDSGAFLFETPDSQRVPLSQIRPIRARPQGIANARPLMANAALTGSRRQPLSVRAEPDGTFTLLDGNSTYAVLSEVGAADAPVRVFTDEEFEAEQARDAIRKVLKSPGKKPRLIDLTVLRKGERKSATELVREKQPFLGIEEMVGTADQQADQDLLNSVMREAVEALGLPYKDAPPKDMARSAAKVETDYSGNHRQLADSVRAGFSPQTAEHADAVIAALSAKFTVLDSGYAVTPVGYFDRKLSVILPSGRVAEIQMWPPGMLDAKTNGGHALYTTWRDPSLPQDARDFAEQRMLDLYSEVMSALDASWAPVLADDVLRNEEVAARISASVLWNSISEISGARSSPSTLSGATAQSPVPVNSRIEPSSASATTPMSVSNQRAMNEPPIAGETSVPGSDADVNRFRVMKQSGTRREPSSTGATTGVAMPTNLASAAKLALDNRFKTGRDFKVALQEMATEGLTGYDDETAAKLSDFAFEDALEAVQDNMNAIGWYDRKVTAAKAILREIYPELEPGSEAEFVFTWALAVTSNGVKVVPNFQLAAQVYEQWRTDGTFPRVRYGTATEGINIGLQMFFQLREQFDSWQEMRDYMVGRHEVRDVEARTGIAVGGEAKGEIVAGAAVLGPKIGNGFFSNLYGYFDMLTMDRWLMRTVGRWRGTLITVNPELVSQNRNEVRELLGLLTEDESAALLGHIRAGLSGPQQKRFDSLSIGADMSDADTDTFAELVRRASVKPEWRDTMNALPHGDLLRRLGNRLDGNLDGQNEDPNGAADRTFLRKVFGMALDRLRAEPGLEQLTMADLQALLWYPEKLLYDSAKKKPGEEIKSYEDDEAPDYENAARALYQQKTGRPYGDGVRGAERGADVSGSADAEGRPEGGAGDRRLAQSGARLRGGDGGVVAFRGREVQPVAVFGSDARPVYEIDDPGVFGDLIREAKAALGPLGAQVTAYDDYSGKRLFLFDGGASGFALDGDDIISVFSSPDSARGVVETMMPVAVAEGGRRLDAFNTFLPKVYARAGFRAVARLGFNRDFAPDGWDYDFFSENFGESDPDIAFMVYDPQQATADTDNVVSEYDDGIAAQTAALAEQPRAMQQQDRGEIRIPTTGVLDGTAVIELFKSADASTFLHESGHYFLEVFQSVAAMPDAPQQIVDDMAAINEFLGREPGDQSTFTTAQQERWAEAFEAYLMEGVAPSPSLKSAFRKFSIWLTAIYKRLTNIGAQPTPEIRAVMDRMLATDEEIEAARAMHDSEALFSEIPPGMTEDEWRPYVKLVEREEAETYGRALKAAMAKIRRRRTAEYKRRKVELEAEVRQQLAGQRAYQVIEGLGNGGLGLSARLDKADVVSMFGEQVLQDLDRKRHGTKTNLYAEQGSPVEMVAETFGYDSPGQMITDLQAAQPLDDAVEAEVTQRLDRELGSPEDDADIREEAEAALKNGLATERVARELAHLERVAGGATGPTRWQTQNAAAKADAERRVDGMLVRDVLGYRQFLRASQKAARDAQRALAKVVRAADGSLSQGSREALQAAAEAKRRQLLNDHLYRISRDKARRFEAARKRFQRLQKRSTQQKIGAEFMDGINSLLDQYSFRNIPASEVRRRASILELHQQMVQENRGSELAIPVDVLARTQEVHYTQLSSAQLEGVIDAIDNIAHMGRATQKQIAADEAFDTKTALDAIADRAERNLKSVSMPRESVERGRMRNLWRQFQLHVLNADTILRDIDGDETALGPAYRSIKQKIDEGVGRADARRQQAAEDIYSIYKKYLGSAKKIAKMRADKRVYPELGDQPLTRLGLISMALNAGNQQNWERLTNPDGKGSFSADAVREVLVRELTENEWRFVQAIWDYLDSFWPEISAQERKYTGVTPKKVSAQIMIPGAPDFVTGGYYPIRYDSGLSSNVNDMERAQLATEGTVGVFGKAQTMHGHTKERLRSTGRPLDIGDLGVIDNHVFNVIHDLELRGPVRDAARIVYSEQFGDILTDKGRGEDVRALKAWLEDVAVGDKIGAYGATRWFRWMRGGFTLSAIGFKVSTIMIQPLGVTQSIVQVGAADMARGYAQYMKQGPLRMHRFAVAKSAIMQERIRTFDKDISQITQEITSGQQLQRGYEKVLNTYLPWAYYGMQMMQYWSVDLPTWLASYEKALRAGESDADAVTIADRDVRIAQGSGLMSDRGMLERGRWSPDSKPGESARLLTVLGSFMFSKFNLAYRRIHGTNMRDPRAVAKLTADIMILFVVEAMLVYMLRNGWPDEEDDEPPLPLIAAREGFYTALGTMPILRDFGSALQGFGAGGSYDTYVGALADLARGVEDVASADIDLRTVKNLLSFGGTAFFLPSGQLNTMMDALFTRDFEIEDDALINLLEAMTGLPVGGENN